MTRSQRHLTAAALALAGILLLLALVTCGGGQHAAQPARPGPTVGLQPPEVSVEHAFAPLVDADLQLLVTPSPEGHQPFIRAIDEARSTVEMTMFHLTDMDVVDALVRAEGRGVHVRVIVDGKSLKPHANHDAFEKLRQGGVEARPSSPAFSITHVKAMVVDGDRVFVTAINLTRDADRTRDLGIVTRQHDVVEEVERIFEADWHNAETKGHDTPPLHDPSLVVSPVSSRAKLIALVDSAKKELLVTVENLGDPKIDGALAGALQRHVHLRLVVPMCDKNPNPLYNLPAALALAHQGAEVRVMPAPETAETPYMHSKMILADGTVAYVGSINFSTNSTTKARELGIIFENAAATEQIHKIFDADWRHAVPPPEDKPAHCTDVRADDESPADDP